MMLTSPARSLRVRSRSWSDKQVSRLHRDMYPLLPEQGTIAKSLSRRAGTCRIEASECDRPGLMICTSLADNHRLLDPSEHEILREKVVQRIEINWTEKTGRDNDVDTNDRGGATGTGI